MRIKGVLWDMDGVIADTGEFHYLAWSRTLEAFHIPYSRELFLETFGMNNRAILERLLGREGDDGIKAKIDFQKEVLFRQVIHGQAQPLPGVLETLHYLKSAGVRQAIASSAPPENVNALVDELKIRENFAAIVSGYNMAGKPAPDVFLAAAKAIGVQPVNCLVIEDAVTGVEGAKRAGMACLAVTNTNPAEKLHHADYVADSLFQIDKAFWDLLIDSPRPTP